MPPTSPSPFYEDVDGPVVIYHRTRNSVNSVLQYELMAGIILATFFLFICTKMISLLEKIKIIPNPLS